MDLADYLDRFAIGCLEDVARPHSLSVYHVLAGSCDDVHLRISAGTQTDQTPGPSRNRTQAERESGRG
jgi:hypothetical protein